MTQPSNRNGGRPPISPELRTERRTVTIRRIDLDYLSMLDSNLSVAIRKLIAANQMLQPAACPARPKAAKAKE